MKLPVITFTTLLLGSVAFAQDASPAPSASAAPKKAGQTNEQRFKKYDKDNDGSISLEEYTKGKTEQKDIDKASTFFKNRDKDQDGKLTLEEFSTGQKPAKGAASEKAPD